MTALALALAAALGCPEALAEAARLDDAALAPAAAGLVSRLGQRGPGAPTLALAWSAALLAEGPDAGALAPRARAFRALLARHCAAAALPGAPPASDADRAALREVLARPEFRRARVDPLALRRMLLGAWSWLLERLGSAEAERWAGLGRALFLGAAAAAAALATIGWRRRRGRRPHAGRGPGAAVLTAGPGADGALARAQAALARGEHAAAVRDALLAALGALERSGRLPRGRALTNAEVVGAIAALDAGLAEVLRPLARAFDRSVYGGRAPGGPEARDAVEGARRIDAAVRA